MEITTEKDDKKVTTKTESHPYNYPNFKAEFYQFHDFTGLEEGDQFVDFELTTLQGEKAKISDFLDKPLVFEMGSISCPMYAGHVTPMQEIARRHPEYNFVVLYVREAHPGEKITNHTTFEKKMYAATEASKFYDDHRTILIDEVDGRAHKVYGALPNTVYVIATDGTIKFVKAWNNTDYLEPVLEHITKGRSTNELKFRPAKPGLIQSYKTFKKCGRVSLTDFLYHLPKLLWKHYKAGNLF
ncbi:MAG: peroxiredoxin family protein [Thermonemataceae bacterium]